MKLSEFEHRYIDAQNRFANSLQNFTTAIEIVAVCQPQSLSTLNQTMLIIREHIPQMLADYEQLTVIVDQFFNSQSPRNYPPHS